MKKIALISLVLAVLTALVMPALAPSGEAEAWGWRSTNPEPGCDTTELNFTAIEGVNPSNQTIGVFNAGDGTLWWKVSDDASWLSTWPSFGRSRGETDTVKVSVNSKRMAPGNYTASIKVSKAWGSGSTITIPVNLEIIEPQVMGPIMIGMEGIFPWSPDDVYKGMSLSLLTGESGIQDLSGAAIETGPFWKLSLERGDPVDHPLFGEGIGITGTIVSRGEVPSGDILEGSMIVDIGPLLASLGMDLPEIEGLFLMMLSIDTNGDGSQDESYIGMMITELDKIIDLLPMLSGLMGDTDASGDWAGPNGQLLGTGPDGIVIPLDPIMSLLPKVMPVFMDLLSNPELMELIKPILGAIPPVVIIMPEDVMMELVMSFL